MYTYSEFQYDRSINTKVMHFSVFPGSFRSFSLSVAAATLAAAEAAGAALNRNIAASLRQFVSASQRQSFGQSDISQAC